MSKSIPVAVLAVSAPMRCNKCGEVRAYAYYVASWDADSSTAVPLCEICAE